MSTLTRHDIIMELRRVMKLSGRRAAQCVSLVFRTMRAALESGDPVQIHAFGGWEVKVIRGRTYRARNCGQMRRKRPRREINFTPSPKFKPGLPTYDDGMVNPPNSPGSVGASQKRAPKRRLGIEKARTYKRPF